MLPTFTVSRWTTCFTLLGVVAVNVGCQSGGSRWARYNPWSSGPDTTVVAESEPKMPTDGSTPQIEGIAPATTAIASAETEAPAFQPSTTPPTTPPASTPSLPAGTAPVPPTQVAATSTPAAPTGGPYDPNAFRSSDPSDNAIAAVASSLRATAEQTKQSVTESATTLGNRYANVAAPAAGDLPDFSFADNGMSPAAVGGRYAATTPAAPATPPSNPLAAPSYPVATTPAPSTPIAVATQTPLPSETTPVTPAVQPAGGAIASAPTRVELTAGPGEYRPAGTGSYLGSVNVAARPQPQAQPTGNAYPTTGQQYR